MSVILNKLQSITDCIPMEYSFDYEVYSSSMDSPIIVTFFYQVTKTITVHIERHDFLSTDNNTILSEEKKIKIIIDYIKDLIFERLMLITN